MFRRLYLSICALLPRISLGVRKRALSALSVSIAICVWLGLALFGLIQGARYDATPAKAHYSKVDWPDSRLTLGAKGYTIVLFAHPACPCTGASLHQLREASARAREPLTIYIVSSFPATFPRNQAIKSNERIAQEIRGASRVEDKGCKIAAAFRATTSGQCFVYDAAGKQVFQGGLTRARGHTGDSKGLESILALINAGSSTAERTPIFGCPLDT